jgi:hypothetical protein
MNISEFRDYHERVAARLRSVAATATTAAMKARLLQQAEEHECLARSENTHVELDAAS